LRTGTPLTPEEREIISRELVKEESTARSIGRLLGRDHSGIAKEIKRNGGRAEYRALAAQERCDAMRARPKERKLEASARLQAEVNAGLAKKWSPEQIGNRLKEDHPDDAEMRVSHETIYECLYLQARGELRTQLKIALRSGRIRRVSRSRTTVAWGKIRDMTNISDRPKEADDRAVPGFWEGDLVRHEALCYRAEVEDLRRCAVAAA
jgi:IS30 family transposase